MDTNQNFEKKNTVSNFISSGNAYYTFLIDDSIYTKQKNFKFTDMR